MDTQSTNLSTNAIPRVADEVDDNAMVMSLTMRVLTTKWKPSAVDAIAPLSGQDDLKRFKEPIKIFNRSAAKFLIVGRAKKDEETFHPLHQAGLVRHCGLRRLDGFITTDHLDNTGDQVQWVMKTADLLQVESLALFTSPYHIFRAFGTAIQTLGEDESNWIPILPIFTGELDDPVPELVKQGLPYYGYDMVANEIKRYFTYSDKARINPATGKPDVASLNRIDRFLNWMRNTHPHLYQ